MRNTTRDYVKFTGNGDWGVDYLTPNHQAVDTPVEGGETYTFSAWVKNDKSSAGRIDLEIYQWNANHENKTNGSSSEVSVWASPGEEKRLVFTKTLLADTTSVRLHTRNKDRDGIVTYWTKMAQVEKGTIATDWSPAPEDMTDRIEVLSGKVTANSNEFSTVYTKITNAKNDAINAIKGDSQWQSMGKIVTNASFLQTADGFEKEVVKKATPMVEGGGVNLAAKTSKDLQNVNVTGTWIFVGHKSSSYFNDLSSYQGKHITVRVWIERPTADAWVQIWTNKVTISGNHIKAGQSGYSTASGVIPTGFTDWNIPVGGGAQTMSFGWKELKIELGEVATPWTPAPRRFSNRGQCKQGYRHGR